MFDIFINFDRAMDIKKQKAQLRKKILSERNLLPEAHRTESSRNISEIILELSSFKQSEVVAVYMSFGSEFETGIILAEGLRLGKTIVLPKIESTSHVISFYSWSGKAEELLVGRWGIREPDPARSECLDMQHIDFLLVPGVAFSQKGQRLGYGGGYYDSVMSKLPESSTLVAAAFSLQIVPEIPIEEHDASVQSVISG
ncbi:MAG: 5-formyltetrahydrofolate cyclo-ligase [Proteobacteria bacterium]|nr:5-formyltetrahydrofolate cyclo-ligase [Pseudomonadota bacterium]MDA1332050.1 5-formyltetrahydrofolate cyclo-ligase [Pseudomonadota bacterium]